MIDELAMAEADGSLTTAGQRIPREDPPTTRRSWGRLRAVWEIDSDARGVTRESEPYEQREYDCPGYRLTKSGSRR